MTHGCTDVVLDDIVCIFFREKKPVSVELRAEELLQAGQRFFEVDCRYEPGWDVRNGKESVCSNTLRMILSQCRYCSCAPNKGTLLRRFIRDNKGNMVLPIMANGNYQAYLLRIQNIDEVFTHSTREIQRRVCGFVCTSVPEQVRDNDPVSLLLEIRDLFSPISGCRREAMTEEQSRFGIAGRREIIVIFQAAGGEDIFIQRRIHTFLWVKTQCSSALYQTCALQISVTIYNA